MATATRNAAAADAGPTSATVSTTGVPVIINPSSSPLLPLENAEENSAPSPLPEGVSQIIPLPLIPQENPIIIPVEEVPAEPLPRVVVEEDHVNIVTAKTGREPQKFGSRCNPICSSFFFCLDFLYFFPHYLIT